MPRNFGRFVLLVFQTQSVKERTISLLEHFFVKWKHVNFVEIWSSKSNLIFSWYFPVIWRCQKFGIFFVKWKGDKTENCKQSKSAAFFSWNQSVSKMEMLIRFYFLYLTLYSGFSAASIGVTSTRPSCHFCSLFQFWSRAQITFGSSPSCSTLIVKYSPWPCS